MGRRKQRGGFITGLLARSLHKESLKRVKQKGGILPLLMVNVIRRKTRESFKRRRTHEDRLLQEGAGSSKRRKRKNRKQKGSGWKFPLSALNNL